jgi:hypothetical protein
MPKCGDASRAYMYAHGVERDIAQVEQAGETDDDV